MMEQRSTEKAYRYEPHVVSFVHTIPNVLEKLANILTSRGKGNAGLGSQPSTGALSL